MLATSQPKPPSARLSDEVMEYLQKLGRTVQYHDGDVIVRRGDAGRSFFVVLSGRMLRVWRKMPLSPCAFSHVFRFVQGELGLKIQA